MNSLLETLGADKWLEYNAKLQQKKNTLRKALNEKGVMKRDKVNDFDHYQYFSEAGYKQLFTDLFSAHSLELTASEAAYEEMTSNSEKQPNARKVTFKFTLTDCETGFFEESYVSGEALDKGDKAGFKASTGALKYYLANTFMVATGDDPENESPEAKTGKKMTGKASAKQISILAKNYTGDNLTKLLQLNGIEKLEDMPKQKASELIDLLFKKEMQKEVREANELVRN